MEGAQEYRIIAWWSSGRTGLAKSNSAPNAIHFTAPPEFGGLEGRWTPEDLLLSAVASCYTTTFRALAKYSKFEYADLEVEVEGSIRKTDSGYAFNEIVIRPKLTISSEEEQTRALRLLQKAKLATALSSKSSGVHLPSSPPNSGGAVKWIALGAELDFASPVLPELHQAMMRYFCAPSIVNLPSFKTEQSGTCPNTPSDGY